MPEQVVVCQIFPVQFLKSFAILLDHIELLRIHHHFASHTSWALFLERFGMDTPPPDFSLAPQLMLGTENHYLMTKL